MINCLETKDSSSTTFFRRKKADLPSTTYSNSNESGVTQHYFSSKKSSAGFTIIELLIVVGIITIIAGVSSVVYGNLQISAQLNETSAQIAQNLRIAYGQSASGFNDDAHGVKFESSEYIIFQGASYDTRTATYDRAYDIDSALSLSTTLSGDEVVFSRGVGLPNTTGTVTITHSVSGSRNILVSDQGVIQEQ